MFFIQSKRTTDGVKPSEGKGTMHFPFSSYIGEEAAQKLYSNEEVVQRVKAEVEEARREIEKEVTSSLEDLQKDLMGIFQEMPPEEATTPVSEGELKPWPATRAPIPTGTQAPMSEPVVISTSPCQEKTEPVQAKTSNTTNNTGTSTSKTSSASASNLGVQLADLISIFEKTNAEILNRVQGLEESIRTRSKEIKEESQTCCDKAIEQARKIKDLMYEAELKDLEVHKKSMEILDETEDRAIERTRKMNEIFLKNPVSVR